MRSRWEPSGVCPGRTRGAPVSTTSFLNRLSGPQNLGVARVADTPRHGRTRRPELVSELGTAREQPNQGAETVAIAPPGTGTRTRRWTSVRESTRDASVSRRRDGRRGTDVTRACRRETAVAEESSQLEEVFVYTLDGEGLFVLHADVV